MAVRRALAFLWPAGLALLIGLVAWYGIDEVAGAVAAAGWGLILITAWHLLPMLANAIGWFVLVPGTHRPGVGTFVLLRWYSEAINTLLPVAHVGGDVLRGLRLGRSGVGGTLAAATVIVDLTALVVTQVAFSALGIAALFFTYGGSIGVAKLGLGLLTFAGLIAAFFVAQRSGLLLRLATRMQGVTNGFWLTAAHRAARLDRCVRRLHRRRRPFYRCCAWHFAGWLLGIGEVWLALWALGQPASLLDALILESIGMAVRSAAFFVPGALGVQEGVFILIGALIGLDPATALAVSLIKRVRELGLGLPALIHWRLGEGWRRPKARPAEPAA